MRSAAIVVLMLLVVLAGWLGKQAFTIYSGINEMTGVHVARATDEPTVNIPPLDSNHRINILLLGSDNDQKKEEAAPLTQSMIVVSIDPRNYTVSLLSIPRDFWVPIRGHGFAKVDLAFKYGYQQRGSNGGMSGGVQLARWTIEKMFHVPIDYYAWVGLDGFSNVIDTFGGVTLDVEHPVLDDTYPNDIHSPDPYGMRRLFIPAGWQHMDGPSALDYVRSRHGDRIGDFARSQRQQQVLLELRQKINAINVLTRLPQLVQDLRNSVRTDLTLQQLYQLDELSHHLGRNSIHRLVLSCPRFCNYAFSSDGQSILQPHWSVIAPRVRALFAPISPPRPSTSPPRTSATGVASPTARPTSPSTSRPQPTATRRPTALHAPPANLLFVKGGNIYELSHQGAVRQLTWSGDTAMPEVSPDGRMLAFVRFTNGLHKYDKYASDIWLMNMATRRQYPITKDENAVPANNLWAAWPSWSPDGKEILFSSDRGKLSMPPSDARPIDFAIWSVLPNGRGLRQLTTPSQGAGGDTDPASRPHSRQYVYVAWSYPSSSTQASSRLILLDSRSGRSVSLTSSGQRVLAASWSPDGRRITYLQGRGNANQIVVAALSRNRLVNARVVASGHLAHPAFTPDGKEVSFLRVNGDSFEMDLVSMSGRTIGTVPSVPGDLDARWPPVWIR